MPLPRVAVLGVGGTIAMTARGEDDVVDTSLTADDLVSAVPQLERVADILPRSVAMVPGSHLGMEDVAALAALIRREVEERAHGVVVTQGTDTIEETAFLLDILLDLDAPVVVTGAMRNPTSAGADGPANLLASVRVAASAAARGLGVLAVMNDEIHSATFVEKRHTSAPSAFSSALVGPLGAITEDAVHIFVRPLRRFLSGTAGERFGSVAIAACALGDDGRLLSKLVDLGYDGVVIEALGGGHVPVAIADAVGSLTRSMPVVLCSRTRVGHVLTSTYGFVGSETDLLRRGAIHGGFLPAPKARLLLAVLTGQGLSADEIKSQFAQWMEPS
jgi:L-asparaginase